MTYEIVAGEDVEAIKALPARLGRSPHAVSIPAQLALGVTLWAANPKQQSSAGTIYRAMSKRGMRLITRSAERDGVRGFYMWAVPAEEGL